MKLKRPLERPDGTVTHVTLPPCRCDEERRGPEGGVCGRCGGAIPTESEGSHA